jgi:N-acetylglucosamine-6-sulfatase
MGDKAGLFSRPGSKKVVALFVVLVVMSVPAASRIPREAEAAVRPNIILVLTDDQDENTLQYMPYVAEEFQASATTFPNATYNFPLCCPSRVSILRGQYTHNHKVWDAAPPDGGYDRFVRLREDNSHVARWLNKAGYRTGMFGKYINGYNPQQDVPKPGGWDKFLWMGYSYDGSPAPPKAYGDEVVKDNAVRWIKKNLPGGPLFAWISFKAPHAPYGFDHRYAGRFTEAQLPQPPSFNEADVSDKPRYVSNRPQLTDAQVTQLTHDYRGRLRGLLTPDDAVRRIVEALKSAGELDNTYIVFWSDNGFMMGQHRLLAKKHAYVESISFPMIVSGPNVQRGASDPRIVMNQDLASTFAELANVRVPAFVDGRSMVPIFAGGGSWRDVGLIEGGKPRDPSQPPSYRGIRDEDYTYVEYATGEREYYDLRTDPYQLTNAYDSLNEARKAELHERTLALARCASSTCRSLEE